MAEAPNFALALQEIRQQNELNRIQQEQSDARQVAADRENIRALGEKIEKASNKETRQKLEADKALLQAQIEARKDAPTKSDAKKELETQQSGLERLKEQIEANGGKAEANLAFQKQANRIRRQELALQKQSATNPSERKEIAKEQRKAQIDALKLAFAPVINPIQSLVGSIKGIADIKTGIPGLTLGRLALLAFLPFVIRFLRSPEWDKIREKINNVNVEDVTGVIGKITKGVLGLFRVIGYVATGIGNIYNLITGNLVDENGKEIGRLQFLKENFGSMIAAIGAFAAFFAPSLLFGAIKFGGKAVFGAGKWLIFKPIQAAFNSLFKSLGLLATQADDIALRTTAMAASKIPKGPVKGQKFKTAKGKVVTFTGKAGEFVDDAGKVIKGAAGAQITKGIQSGAVKGIDPAAANKAKLIQKYPRLKALFTGAGSKILKAVPVLGTLLTVGAGASILLSDASKEEKTKELGALLFGTLGASGLAILGGIGGTFFGGPLGTLLGTLSGAVGGYFAGDFIGRQLAGFLLGDEVTASSVPKVPAPTGMSPGAMGGSGLPPQSVVTPQQLETNPFAAYALEGQQMGQSAVATANANRTDAVTESALNKVDQGFRNAPQGPAVVQNNGGNTYSNQVKTINRTSIKHEDPVYDMIGKSLAM